MKAHESTMQEWIDSEIRNSKYAEEYLEDPDLYSAKAESLKAVWYSSIKEHAKTSRLNTEVIDDIVKREGINALRSFRGEYEKGIEGYEPEYTRIWDKPYREVLQMAKAGKLGEFISDVNVRAWHKQAIIAAALRGETISERVTKEYKELKGNHHA